MDNRRRYTVSQEIHDFLNAHGTSGLSGTSGINGSSGIAGSSGTAGFSGDLYSTTSSNSLTIPTSHPTTVTLTGGTYLAYTPGQEVIVSYDSTHKFNATITTYTKTSGVFVLASTSNVGTGTYSSWFINTGGAPGASGADGTSGTSGRSGSSGISFNSIMTSYGDMITNWSDEGPPYSPVRLPIGTSGAVLTVEANYPTWKPFTSGSSGKSGSSGSSGSSGKNGSSGSSGSTGNAGTSGSSGVGSLSFGTAGRGAYYSNSTTIASCPLINYDSGTNTLTLG